MSSLHTKYRPQTLEDVMGQDAAIKSIKRVLKGNRAHAFLFAGPAGTGKTTLARILAKSMGTGVAGLNEHPAALKPGADDMRELVAKASYKAIGESPIKFFIIDECQKLSSAAWDVLLKPTEEPPQHVYYAFCTTNVGKVPKAILTRCLRYNLKPVKEELILELLDKIIFNEKLTIIDDIVELIAESSEGSPRQALVYLEACVGAKSIDEARDLMRSAGETKEIVDLARWLVSGKAQHWREAARFIKAIDAEPESIRIVLQNYFAAVLLNTTNQGKAEHLLRLIEAFKTPYLQSDKLAPLLYSLGLALEIDRNG